jgi:hypothetical protein
MSPFSSLRIALRKFQEILRRLAEARIQSSALAENDWQAERLPYNV